MTQKTITHRHPLGRRAIKLFKSVYDKLQFDDEAAAQLIAYPDEFEERIAQTIVELTFPQQYIDEQVASFCDYPSSYTPKPIREQIECLRDLFSLKFNSIAIDDIAQPLPPGAEAWFAIPHWKEIGSTYNEAVEKVLEKISEMSAGKFHNYCKDKLGHVYFQEHERSRAMWELLNTAQSGNTIFLIAAQFGVRHRGRSVRRARELFRKNEFGLGVFAVGIMLLTHPERLQDTDDLWIDCAGDEYSGWNNEKEFLYSVHFGFQIQSVLLDVSLSECADASNGSASCFLP